MRIGAVEKKSILVLLRGSGLFKRKPPFLVCGKGSMPIFRQGFFNFHPESRVSGGFPAFGYLARGSKAGFCREIVDSGLERGPCGGLLSQNCEQEIPDTFCGDFLRRIHQGEAGILYEQIRRKKVGYHLAGFIFLV